MEITRVCEDELRQIADEQGPSSAAATILGTLSRKRAKDRQVFAWQLGAYYFVGPPPDAEMEAAIMRLVEEDCSEE